MQPDGRTTVYYAPDTAAGLRERLAALEERVQPPPPSNERPWHKHTLPSRRRR